jgi:cephalosporin hydroxylase
MSDFREEVLQRIAANESDPSLTAAAREFMRVSTEPKYSYNFSWLGRPIIQYPQDMVAMQELLWRVKPDLVIETGIAHGGSLVLSASILALIEHTEAIEAKKMLDPSRPMRRVIGIDIDIRRHNRDAIEAHPMAGRIDMIEGSSIAVDVIERVHKAASAFRHVLVCLDSNHTHDHVLAELEAYAPLVTPGSYCVVFDTVIEDLPDGIYPNRPWSRGNNPKSAVQEYMRTHSEFEVDQEIDNKLLISVAPGGYLRRIG